MSVSGLQEVVACEDNGVWLEHGGGGDPKLRSAIEHVCWPTGIEFNSTEENGSAEAVKAGEDEGDGGNTGHSKEL